MITLNIYQIFSLKCIFTNYVDVHIINHLGPNSPPLKLQCKSKNDDLGIHMLSTEQEYSWRFCDNFFPTTLFFCHLWWQSKHKGFVAFEENIIEAKRNHRYWLAMPDGIYFSHGNSRFVKKFDWE
ncbi:hypothetical protein PHJA_000943300 [Phtheirospermum japonicum]|uniref:S-protein homolog n=1 Tax=Phtheirospermum japonicum TaxID=374723 RepID=A0A830BMD1_9LAMI|nr:hypothetical protein PHJA_000943300 [Phtheirospermum japonicum]